MPDKYLILLAYAVSRCGLSASNILIRNAQGRTRRKAHTVRILREIVHSNKWDVRFIGAAEVRDGADGRALNALAKELLAQSRPKLPGGVIDILRQMLSRTTARFAVIVAGAIASIRSKDR